MQGISRIFVTINSQAATVNIAEEEEEEEEEEGATVVIAGAVVACGMAAR